MGGRTHITFYAPSKLASHWSHSGTPMHYIHKVKQFLISFLIIALILVCQTVLENLWISKSVSGILDPVLFGSLIDGVASNNVGLLFGRLSFSNFVLTGLKRGNIKW